MTHLLCAHANRIFNGDCFAKSRKRENVNARMAVAVILRDKNFYTLAQIGKIFNLNHDMVFYYQKKHVELMKFNKEYRTLFNLLINYSQERISLKEGYCNYITFAVVRISKSQ